jgi:hypothetical protein
MRLWLLRVLSLCLRTVRLLRPAMVRWWCVYWSWPLVPWLLRTRFLSARFLRARMVWSRVLWSRVLPTRCFCTRSRRLRVPRRSCTRIGRRRPSWRLRRRRFPRRWTPINHAIAITALKRLAGLPAVSCSAILWTLHAWLLYLMVATSVFVSCDVARVLNGTSATGAR